MKILFILILFLNILVSKEENTNIVKTSELELFLFKVGFESLLKDVDISKNKSSLNQYEILKLNNKIEIIMDELYKNKRILKTDNSSMISQSKSNNNEELKILKEEIKILKKQMKELKVEKKVKITSNNKLVKIKVKLASVRNKPFSTGKILYQLKKGSQIYIESCDKYEWCKLENENKYIARYMFNL